MSSLATGDCGVCIGGDYGEGTAEFHDAREVKARKPHKCCECRREISVGAVYMKACGKFDGEFYSFATCMVCAELRACLSCEGVCAYECLWEEIVDYVFPQMTTGCLEKLKTAAAKQYLVERWNQWKFRKKTVAQETGEVAHFMTQHFTRNTVSAALWCAKCQKQTQHRIDGVRRGPCLDCITRLEGEHAKHPAKDEAEQQSLFGAGSQVRDREI
jgi:hypothetical protein